MSVRISRSRKVSAIDQVLAGERTACVAEADCLDVLAGLPSACIDLVVADPPYLIGAKSDGRGRASPWADLCNSSTWFQKWIGECRRVLKPTGALWSCLNWRSLPTFYKASCDLGWSIESLLVWDKEWIGTGSMRGLRCSYELVALWRMEDFGIANRSAADVQRFKWSSRKPHGHPAEKPVDLMRWLIEQSGVSEGIILDPFAGSGTSLVAALDFKCRAVGIEVNETFAAIARKRLAAWKPESQVA